MKLAERWMAGAAILMTSAWPSLAWAQARPYEWGWGMHPVWGIWGFGMMVMMLFFWALVIAGLVVGIRWLLGREKDGRFDPALEILRERYARGEINKEEFDARKRDLS